MTYAITYKISANQDPPLFTAWTEPASPDAWDPQEVGVYLGLLFPADFQLPEWMRKLSLKVRKVWTDKDAARAQLEFD